MQNRAGEYRTNLSGKLQYKSFLPQPLPPNPPLAVDEETVRLLSEGSRKIGTLEGLSSQIANVDLFVSMYMRKEALLSSQIEGTQATLDDILDPRAEENANLDVAEVLNYIKASWHTMARLTELPPSVLTRSIKIELCIDDEGGPGGR